MGVTLYCIDPAISETSLPLANWELLHELASKPDAAAGGIRRTSEPPEECQVASGKMGWNTPVGDISERDMQPAASFETGSSCAAQWRMSVVDRTP